MILKTAHVKNFKCVRDSNSFKVDPDVTCLVGKNESGKTALLQALYKLNPVVETQAKFEDIEYPRAFWSEYQERKDARPAEALITTWEIEDDDTRTLEALIGPSAADIKFVQINKGYDNKRAFIFNLDEAKVVAHVLDQCDLNETEREALGHVNGVPALAEAASKLQPPSPQVQKLQQDLQSKFQNGTARQAVEALLGQRLPRFVYFSEYMRLPGQMSIEDYKAHSQNAAHARADEYRMFGALLSLVGKTAQDVEKIDKFETLQAELEAVSARISKTIFKYWSQNRHLRVQFRFDQARAGDPPPFNAGYVMRTRIENTRHASTTSFDDRSTGFVWFFSFLVWFGQVQKNYGNNLVILLDEPGLSLHAKAQADLLRYIEEQLAPAHQVIYTTHSPFMIDPSNLLRARTVEDVVQKRDDGDEELLGTKVGDDVLSTDRDTVFPLQACLGYEITQTLFVGKHTLLVEGPSDLLYLKWFQHKLAGLGRLTLDRRWTIAPCGGIDKIAAFMSLFRGNNLHVAVLTDFKEGEKKKVRSLAESKLMLDGHVLTAAAYAGQPEADIEDIIGAETYLALVNAAYSLTGSDRLTPPAPSAPAQRILPIVESAFSKLPVGVPPFDHYRPSEFLAEQPTTSDFAGIQAALSRFERLFTDLNSLLPSAG